MNSSINAKDISKSDISAVSKPLWKRLLLPALLLLIFGALYASGLHEQLSYAAFLENRLALKDFVDHNLVRALLAFMGIYALSVAFALPGASFLTISGGFLFGWIIGGSATVIAATIGACAIFLAAKTALGSWLEQKCGSWMQKIGQGFREDAFSYMLSLRLIPLFPFFVVNIAPAFFNVSFRSYALSTLLGIMPGTFAYSFLGAGLDSVFANQHAEYTDCVVANGTENCSVSFDFASIITTELIAAFTLLGLVALIPIGLKKIKARKASQ